MNDVTSPKCAAQFTTWAIVISFRLTAEAAETVNPDAVMVLAPICGAWVSASLATVEVTTLFTSCEV